MILDLINKFNLKSIILGSTSPRRKTILAELGLQFSIIPSTFEENLNHSHFASPLDYVKENARLKTDAVAKCAPANSWLVIGADTIVVKDGIILEKPVTNERAVQMLTELSGSCHEVYTSVVFHYHHVTSNDSWRVHQFEAVSKVKMAELPPELIHAYVATGDSLDKAGGYGIQSSLGGCLIESIDGDFFNIVGFPLQKFSVELRRLIDSGELQL